MDISGGYSYDEKNEDVPGEVIVAKKKGILRDVSQY